MTKGVAHRFFTVCEILHIECGIEAAVTELDGVLLAFPNAAAQFVREHSLT